MSRVLQLRRGTTVEHSTFTGKVSEVTVDTDKNVVVVHDDTTAGGHPLAPAVSPTFTGVPTAPTAAPGTNTTQLATTAFALANVPAAYTVNAQTAAAPAVGDYLGGYDTSATAEKKFLAEEVAALALANPGYRTNAYYLAVANYPSNNTFTVTANRAVFQLFSICKAATFTRVGIEVTTAGAAGSKAKIGVYAAVNGAPGALLHDLGEVATDGIAVVELTISLSLVPGLYYLCVIPSGTPVVRRTNAEGTSLTMFYGADAISTTGAVGNLYRDVGSYTLPNPAGAVTGASSLNTNPTLWLRVV